MTTPSRDQAQAVAWIGVGKMGLPIAGRMVEAGIRVTGYDPGQQRMALAQQLGLQTANSAADAAANHLIIFTSLPDDAALRSVVLGPDGLLNRLTRGAVLVETSTVSAEISAEVGVAAEASGVTYLRAPVSGNAAIAHTGALTCFVSGPRNAFDAVQPVLATFTRAQTYLGVAEEARFAKLAVNLMIAVSAGMMAESLALARKGGISWPDILKVLDDSAVASPMVKYKTPPLATRNFESTFSCRQMAKDLDLIIGAGHHVGVPLQLAAQVREIYGSLIAQGDGESDFIATVRHVERLSGLGEPKLG
ncbi:NAD(P)-dependent oxidoreductase [Tardiphaga sp. 20_F10_N6_6]|jgi:3-hydroxyisobutyrate dehydrogenase-like beta-hydroxyacid dehydrogenase|uniref:NAD(P)-dependent oxidoreductase n=1 Tax=unclassified Tardiphaga TaxID=2631404 RepID=UPI003F242FFB